MEYANQIWSPHHIKHIDALENVQRKATKQIPGLSHLSDPKRLELIGLPTLAYRYVIADMTEMYKILGKTYDQDVTDFTELRSDTTRRGHRYKYMRYALYWKI